MRTPRSNFIVEYKTNRRQTLRRTSIWGDLDLQAVARAVEADDVMPKLDLPQAASVQEDVVAVKFEVVDYSDVPIDGEVPPDSPAATSSSKEFSIESEAVEDDASDPTRSVHQQRSPGSGWTPKSGAKARSKKTPSASPASAPILNLRRDPPLLCGLDEELAALEAENRHLRSLMVVKLRKENERLKFMLRRFGQSR
ncbi:MULTISPECIES: hypothetical protein [Rhizobium/Agrobacterium group]|uniref:Rcorf99 n=4 Tax=Rhizobium/Agrobacterium group TaxID=227290 RepID=A8W0E3_RHIRH|nr:MULTISPECIES: hypothetical protein [Rhizobium/Agrobacterium group]ABW33656.1 rcorf99 [Rhizobium rhizogenes]ASK42153.1 hypothetical protein [Rhizobium rhizogenes]MCZ7445601.1 hypothetical protein [Rhizobium rhizogenes]MCZ7472569.1 hypothetical protein [Rhizobium rhizogenes]MCZ7483945.1 hypothetical protein [Rhizobium rhizogenes]